MCSGCSACPNGARSSSGSQAIKFSPARSPSGRSGSADLPRELLLSRLRRAPGARIAAVLDRAEQPAATRAGIWQSLAFWRGLALSTSALAAACLAALIYVGAVIPPRTPLVAQLRAEGGKTGFLAAVNSGGGTLTIVPAALLSGEEQKAMELWLIPPGDKPHSLGLIDPSRPITIKVPQDLLSRDQQGSGARGLSRAARRLTNWTADWSSNRQRQARPALAGQHHENVIAGVRIRTRPRRMT